MKFTIGEYLPQLPKPANEKWIDGVWDADVHSRGDVELIVFAPKGVDRQTFHEKDEYYFIARGSGTLVIGEKRFDFSPGDALFVPALTKHRFEDFTDDFVTWAIFF